MFAASLSADRFLSAAKATAQQLGDLDVDCLFREYLGTEDPGLPLRDALVRQP